MDHILYDVNGPVCTITLNRPDKRNAVDGPMATELLAAFERFEADEGLRVAILTGQDGTFCAGADLSAVGDPARQHLLDADGHGPMGPTRLILSKPLIAAISGFAVAGGLELALLADLRVVEETATLGVFCRRWGVPLIDGGTARLPRIVGLGRALDMILTGRAVGAQEALTMGLVNRVVPRGESLNAALFLAREIAVFPNECMLTDRRSAYQSMDVDLPTALRDEAVAGNRVVAKEGVRGARRFVDGAGRHGAFDV